jgi:hypothetical protein
MALLESCEVARVDILNAPLINNAIGDQPGFD